jgi:hypothetical protein
LEIRLDPQGSKLVFTTRHGTLAEFTTPATPAEACSPISAFTERRPGNAGLSNFRT